MKKNINCWVATIVAFLMFVFGFFLGDSEYRTHCKQVHSLSEYYVCSEHLLGLLEEKYHWSTETHHDGYWETKIESYYLNKELIDNKKDSYQRMLKANESNY